MLVFTRSFLPVKDIHPLLFVHNAVPEIGLVSVPSSKERNRVNSIHNILNQDIFLVTDVKHGIDQLATL
jgi:hypothetical protein